MACQRLDLTFATSCHVKKLVEYRPRLHCTYDFSHVGMSHSKLEMQLAMAIFECSTSQVRTQNILTSAPTAERLHNIKMGPTHRWSHSWTSLTQHNRFGAKTVGKNWSRWMRHWNHVSNSGCACPAMRSCRMLDWNTRSCKLEMQLVVLPGSGLWKFAVWTYLSENCPALAFECVATCKCSPGSRRLPANAPWIGAWQGPGLFLVQRCSWGRGPTSRIILNRQATLW